MAAVAPTLREQLEVGRTLPAEWYSDPRVLDAELERIFGHSWQYAGVAERVAEPGQSFTCRAGVMPVVVVRDDGGAVRAFVGVAPHRRAQQEVQIEAWGPLLFVNPDPAAPPLADVLGALPQVVRDRGLDPAELEYRGRSREFVVNANWKLVVENYLECYHCPVAHKSFSRLIDVDPDTYELATDRWTSSQFGPVSERAVAGAARDLPYQPDGPIRSSQFHYVWPNCTFNTFPGPPNLRVLVFEPDGPDRTRTFVDGFWARDTPDEVVEEITAFGVVVGQEDVELVESVQQGLQSGAVAQGRLMLGSEGLIQHFQLLVHDALLL